MQSLKTFFGNYTLSAHAVIVAIGALFTLYTTVPQFQELTALTYQSMPHWLQLLAAGAVLAYLRYSTGLSVKGKLAVAADSSKALPQATAIVVDAAATAPRIDTSVHVETAMRSITSGFLILAAPAVLLFAIVGCTTQSTIAELTGVFGNAASSVAALEGNSALATKITTDTATAVGQITQWKSGSPATEVVESLTLVEDDLNLVPVTSQYAPLIDLAIGTAESIITAIESQTGGSSVAAAKAHTIARTRVVQLAHPPKTAAQFKKVWNAQAIPGQPKL